MLCTKQRPVCTNIPIWRGEEHHNRKQPTTLREAPVWKRSGQTQTSTLGHLFSGTIFTILAWGKALWKKHTVSYRHKSPKPSWQPSWPPHNQTNAHFSWGTSSLNKCPKPSGQAFRPPAPFGQCPNRGCNIFDGASLTTFGDILGTIRDLGYCFHFNPERFCILIGNRDCISVFLFFWRYEKL